MYFFKLNSVKVVLFFFEFSGLFATKMRIRVFLIFTEFRGRKDPSQPRLNRRDRRDTKMGQVATKRRNRCDQTLLSPNFCKRCEPAESATSVTRHATQQMADRPTLHLSQFSRPKKMRCRGGDSLSLEILKESGQNLVLK